ncbi:1-acylglycerol-3-phosphate O-acyltransferase ABHD5-like isoform X4, partial [Brachionus plicatilis]
YSWNPWNWFLANLNLIETIETNMFKCVKASMERYHVNIRNNSLKIWTVSANTESKNIPIVLVHGFCGGIAMWIPNIDYLSESRPLYAFDLLGFGRSSRPNFSSDPIVAETQFVESIEDWRKEMKIEQFILLGHSFGGYLSTAYSIKYPQRVRALILADPWGFPDKPATKADVQMPMWIRVVAKASQYFGPLSVLRVTGTFGVRVLKHLRPDFRRKYVNLLEDPDAIYDYIYHANRFHPSGEAGFRAIAEYFGYAKNPMIHRIDKVSDNIPIWFIYGSRSWVDSEPGFASISLRQNSVSTSVKLITGAGHHVYADKPNEFNEYVKYIFELIDEFDMREGSDSDAVQIEQ